MRGTAIQARAVTNLSLLFLFLLWLALFAWRKTFSYANVGGVYAIELTVILGLRVFAHAVLARPGLVFALPKDTRIQRALWLTAAFIIYNMVRAVLSPEISAKGLI